MKQVKSKALVQVQSWITSICITTDREFKKWTLFLCPSKEPWMKAGLGKGEVMVSSALTWVEHMVPKASTSPEWQTWVQAKDFSAPQPSSLLAPFTEKVVKSSTYHFNSLSATRLLSLSNLQVFIFLMSSNTFWGIIPSFTSIAKSPILKTWSFKKIHSHDMIFPNTRRSARRRPFSREAIQTSGIFTGVTERQSVCAGIDYCHCMSASSHDSGGKEGEDLIKYLQQRGWGVGFSSYPQPQVSLLQPSEDSQNWSRAIWIGCNCSERDICLLISNFQQILKEIMRLWWTLSNMLNFFVAYP